MSKCFVFVFCLGLFTHSAARAEDIPTDSIRKSATHRYLPLPDFPMDPIEFVRDGVENETLMQQYLKPQTISWVKYRRLGWLQVRDVRVDRLGVISSANGILIPVIASVRYVVFTDWVDGTVNALLRVTEIQGQVHIEVIDYNDNGYLEWIGRRASGIDFKQFIDRIAGDTLRTFLAVPENNQKLIELVKP